MKQKTQTNTFQLWTREYIAMCAMNLILFLGFYMQISPFAFYVEELGGGEALAGLAAGIFSVTSMLMRPVTGWILDNKGRRTILLIGMAGLTVISLIYAFCPLLSIALIMRLIHGVSWAFTGTTTNTIVCDMLPREHYGKGVGYFGMMSSVSSAIAPALGLILMERCGFTVMFCVSAIFYAWSLLLAARRQIIPLPDKPRIPFRRSLKTLINKDALPASILMALFQLPIGGVSTFIALYASKNGLPSGGIFFLIVAIVCVLGRIATSNYIDEHGEECVVYICTAAQLLALLMLAFVPTALCYYLAAALIGLGLGSLTAALQAMAMHLTTPDNRGSASSTFFCGYDIGYGLGGIIAGAAAELWNFPTTYCLLGVASISTFILYFCRVRHHPSSLSNSSLETKEQKVG